MAIDPGGFQQVNFITNRNIRRRGSLVFLGGCLLFSTLCQFGLCCLVGGFHKSLGTLSKKTSKSSCRLHQIIDNAIRIWGIILGRKEGFSLQDTFLDFQTNIQDSIGQMQTGRPIAININLIVVRNGGSFRESFSPTRQHDTGFGKWIGSCRGIETAITQAGQGRIHDHDNVLSTFFSTSFCSRWRWNCYDEINLANSFIDIHFMCLDLNKGWENASHFLCFRARGIFSCQGEELLLESSAPDFGILFSAHVT
mmetsp:Transcript_30212/g.49917  ORF Transcript_30212/g.49917 Transcript_30212/m.49917 type:complete len:253 (-) Transcript_30212:115-873(-)